MKSYEQRKSTLMTQVVMRVSVIIDIESKQEPGTTDVQLLTNHLPASYIPSLK